jgi:hypothetical protein
MNFRKAISLALIPATIIFLTSCGNGTDSPVAYEPEVVEQEVTPPVTLESGPQAINCEDFEWSGVIYFTIQSINGPEIEMVDDGNTEVSNADFNRTVSNYNFKFDLLDQNNNIVASSSRVEFLDSAGYGALAVTFSPKSGYETTQYAAYLDGTEIASENVGYWTGQYNSTLIIKDGMCAPIFDVD